MTDFGGWSADITAVLLGNTRLAGSPAVDRLTFRITPPAATPKYFVRFAFGP